MKECAKCGKRLVTEEYIVHDEHYCSRDCAIEALTDDIIMNAKEAAIEDYDEHVTIERLGVTRCKHCNKPLALNETAWSSIDGMYCSHACGAKDASSKYKEDEYINEVDLRHKAAQYFNDVAEEISREDYGATVIKYKRYSSELGATFVFEQVSEGTTLISKEVIGCYEGTPNNQVTDNSLKVVYVD